MFSRIPRAGRRLDGPVHRWAQLRGGRAPRALVSGAPYELFLASIGALPLQRGTLRVAGCAPREALARGLATAAAFSAPLPLSMTPLEYVVWSARLGGTPSSRRKRKASAPSCRSASKPQPSAPSRSAVGDRSARDGARGGALAGRRHGAHDRSARRSRAGARRCLRRGGGARAPRPLIHRLRGPHPRRRSARDDGVGGHPPARGRRRVPLARPAPSPPARRDCRVGDGNVDAFREALQARGIGCVVAANRLGAAVTEHAISQHAISQHVGAGMPQFTVDLGTAASSDAFAAAGTAGAIVFAMCPISAHFRERLTPMDPLTKDRKTRTSCAPRRPAAAAWASTRRSAPSRASSRSRSCPTRWRGASAAPWPTTCAPAPA